MFSTHSPPSKTTQMRLSKAQTTARVHAFPTLRFEHQRLTAFSGLVLIQALLQRLRLKERLGQCQGPRVRRVTVSWRSISLGAAAGHPSPQAANEIWNVFWPLASNQACLRPFNKASLA